MLNYIINPENFPPKLILADKLGNDNPFILGQFRQSGGKSRATKAWSGIATADSRGRKGALTQRRQDAEDARGLYGSKMLRLCDRDNNAAQAGRAQGVGHGIQTEPRRCLERPGSVILLSSLTSVGGAIQTLDERVQLRGIRGPKLQVPLQKVGQ